MKQLSLLCLGIVLASVFNLYAQRTLPVGLHTLQVPDAVDHSLKKIPVDIIISDSNCNKNILVLPGWNFSRKRWLQETSLQYESAQRHYNLILPEMTVTIYESQYFPETKRKWAYTPGSTWITKILIPYLQQYNLLLPHQFNAVIGLSTGGRGAVLTALYNKPIFKAAASLSGDFDQTKMPLDKLMTAVYGPYTQFEERWKSIDNPYHMVEQWEIPLYLGHGTNDKVVPFSQTYNFYNALKKAKPHVDVVFHHCECGHDYMYWASEVIPILNFFDKYSTIPRRKN